MLETARSKEIGSLRDFAQIWNNRLKALVLGLACAIFIIEAQGWLSVLDYRPDACRDCAPDFYALYTGAQLVWTDGATLYDLDRQFRIQNALSDGLIERDKVLAFAYPPFVAFLLVPFGWLPFNRAFLLMTLIHLLILGAISYKIVRCLHLTRDQTHWLLICMICNIGVHRTFLLGQTSFAALTLFTLFVLATQRQQQGRAGVISALLLFKPQLAVIPFLVLVHQRHWRGVILSLTLGSTLCLFSVGLVGVAGARDYMVLLAQMSAAKQTLGVNPEQMHGIKTLVQGLLPPAWVLPVWTVVGLLIVLALLGSLGREPRGRENFVANGCAIVFAALLLAPHLNAHDLALMVLPYALIISLLERITLAIVATGLVLVGLVPFLLGEVYLIGPALLLASFIACLIYGWRIGSSHLPSAERQ